MAKFSGTTSGSLQFMMSSAGELLYPTRGDTYESHEVPIADMREVLVQDPNFFSLDSSGFELFTMTPSTVLDWNDDGHVMRTYYWELEGFFRTRFGSDVKVLIAGHMARDARADTNTSSFSGSSGKVIGQDKLGTGGFSAGTVARAHNDFSPYYKEALISYLTPGGDLHRENGIQAFKDPRSLKPLGISAEELRASRILVVNVWRGTDRFPVQGRPLALCDQRTIDKEDLKPIHFQPPSLEDQKMEPDAARRMMSKGMFTPGGGTYMALRFNPKQRWYYMSDMQPAENLLLKAFDSEDPWRYHIHASFDDPLTIRTAPPRRSVETRCVLVFPPITGVGPGASKL